VSQPIPFERLGHLLTVPVTLAESIQTRFILDTGIGVNLVSRALAEKVGTDATSRVSKGRRMSGQEIALPIERLSSLRLGGHVWRDVDVSTLEMGSFHPMLRDLGGFLSLGPFEALPFTVDYPNGCLRLHEVGDPTVPRSSSYAEVPLHLERDGPSVTGEVEIDLPGGESARVEVDSGSDTLILHERYMSRLGVTPGAPGVRTLDGVDETGHPYTRHFATVPGEFRLTAAPSIRQEDPPVMFQRIIYDGLLGNDFLRRGLVTFDLRRSRIGFAPGTV